MKIWKNREFEKNILKLEIWAFYIPLNSISYIHYIILFMRQKDFIEEGIHIESSR